MTRHQRLYRPLLPAPPLLAVQLQAALATEALEQSASSERERHRAIACILSASDGWREASAQVGGAFAPEQPDNPWLTTDEEK